MPVIMMGGSFPGVHPLSLSPIIYYDFTTIGNLWKDTARTSAVTADGDAIKGVTCGGSDALHLESATNGPAYKTGILGGQSAALFDGVNDFLRSSSNMSIDDGVADSDSTVMAVIRYPNNWTLVAGDWLGGAAAHGIFGHDNVGTQGPRYIAGATVGGVQKLGNQTSTVGARYGTTITSAANTSYIVTALHEGNELASPNFVGTCSQGLNDTRTSSLITDTSIANQYNWSASPALLGAGYAGANDFANVYIFEIAMYRTVMSEANRKLVETYWAWKYGITLPY